MSAGPLPGADQRSQGSPRRSANDEKRQSVSQDSSPGSSLWRPTTAPVRPDPRACSGKARRVVPSFILAILEPGASSGPQSWLEIGLRPSWRSIARGPSSRGVNVPLSRLVPASPAAFTKARRTMVRKRRVRPPWSSIHTDAPRFTALAVGRSRPEPTSNRRVDFMGQAARASKLEAMDLFTRSRLADRRKSSRRIRNPSNVHARPRSGASPFDPPCPSGACGDSALGAGQKARPSWPRKRAGRIASALASSHSNPIMHRLQGGLFTCRSARHAASPKHRPPSSPHDDPSLSHTPRKPPIQITNIKVRPGTEFQFLSKP